MFRFKVLFAVLSLLSLPLYASELVVEHVANAGVKISSGNRSVIIDALFGPHQRFNYLKKQTFAEFTDLGADVAMATHYHSDHFGAKRTLAFLQQNPDSMFIAPPQILAYLNGKTEHKLSSDPLLTNFESRDYHHNGIRVTALDYPHMSPEHNADTQNYAYIVHINGWKVLHIGDGEIESGIIDGLKLNEQNLDLAILHDLCVIQDDCVARIKQIGVERVAFVHMTDDKAEPVGAWIAEHYPKASMLVTGHESLVLTRDN